MSFFRKELFSQRKDGTIALNLNEDIWDHLFVLAQQLRTHIETDEPDTVRLFPPASATDEDRNTAYKLLNGDTMKAHRLSLLDELCDARGRKTLTPDQAHMWLMGLNHLRLWLGTAMDITEDTEDIDYPPDAPGFEWFFRYQLLGFLQYELLTAIQQ